VSILGSQVKVEIDNALFEPPPPIVIAQASKEGSPQNTRRSARLAKKWLPEEDKRTSSKKRQPKSSGNKLDGTQPKRRRATKKLPPASETNAVQSSSGSVDDILGQLMSTFCGSKDLPADCQDCKNRIDAIHTFIHSSHNAQVCWDCNCNFVAIICSFAIIIVIVIVTHGHNTRQTNGFLES